MVLLLPCGGRDYKSAKAAKADFDSNLSFVVAESTAKFDSFEVVSKADLAEVEFIIILFDDGKRFTTIRQRSCGWPFGMGGFACSICK